MARPGLDPGEEGQVGCRRLIFVLLVIFCLSAFWAGAQPVLSPTQTAVRELLVHEVLGGQTEGARIVMTPIPLEGTGRFEFRWTHGVTEIPTKTYWVAVVDRMPGVLGFHPVQHVFLDQRLSILEMREANYYPRFYAEGIRQDWVTLLEFRARPGRVPEDRKPIPAGTGAASKGSFTYNEFYAVIIEGDVPSGSSYSEFWSDPVQMFRLLLEYGYKADHIHVLYGEGHDEDSFACTYYREKMVDFAAYQQDVRNLFTWMKDGNAAQGIDKVTDQDFIFLFTFDHGSGNSTGCDASLCLMDGCMADTEFANYFNKIAFKHRGVMMQQCYSGGFIDNLQNDRTAISTAANCNESAYEADQQDSCDGTSVKYGEWNYWWISAMRRHKPWPGEQPVDADTNHDGKVSFKEAHNYAVANDDQSEHPMWSDLGNIGDQLSLETTYNGAHLIHDSHRILDSAGNGDGVADAGETVVMPVTLADNGTADATGISGTLSTTNPWVSISDASANFPDIAVGAAAESFPDHFQWTSSPDTPDNTQVAFTLDWTTNGGAYHGIAAFSQVVVKTILTAQKTTIEDTETGNGNHLADPGEAFGLAVTMRNKGHADARQVQGTLTCPGPWATVTQPHATFPDIAGQASGRTNPPHFGISLRPDTPLRTWVECTLDATAAGGYHFTLPIKFIVGSRGTALLVEDGDPADADLLENQLSDFGFGVVRESASVTDPTSWSAYNFLTWAAGSNSNPVTSDQRTALINYVKEGGRLFIEGGELRQPGDNADFRTQVLHFNSFDWSEPSGNLEVQDKYFPLATTPNLLDATLVSDASGHNDKDSGTPTTDAKLFLAWAGNASRAALVAFDDDLLEGNGGQIVTLLTPPARIQDDNGQRRQLLQNIVEWLAGNDKPYLLVTGNAVLDSGLGNGDGIIDPGETFNLSVDLQNRGSGTATGVFARAISDLSDKVIFVDNYAAWQPIASGATARSLDPHFVLRVAENTPCGTLITITLQIATAEGWTGERHFTLKVGNGGGRHITYPSTDTPKQIPNPGTLVDVINIPDVVNVGDLNCQLELQFSSISLVRVVLKGPDGTTVTLHDRKGAGNTINTIYDKQTQPQGPGSMSDFDGKLAAGDWKIEATDFKADSLMGALKKWSVILDTADYCRPQHCTEGTPGAVGNGLRLTRLSGTDVRLTWDPVPNASGYNVWRSRSADFGNPETAGSAAIPQFDEVGLPMAGQLYFYQVRAENRCRVEGP